MHKDLEESIIFAKESVEKMRLIVAPNFESLDKFVATVSRIAKQELTSESYTVEKDVNYYLEHFADALRPGALNSILMMGYIGHGLSIQVQIIADRLTLLSAGIDPSFAQTAIHAMYYNIKEPNNTSHDEYHKKSHDDIWEKWQIFEINGTRLEMRYPPASSVILQTHHSPFYGCIGSKFGEKGSPEYEIRHESSDTIIRMNAEQIHLLKDFLFLQGMERRNGNLVPLRFRIDAKKFAEILSGKNTGVSISYHDAELMLKKEGYKSEEML